LRPIRGTATQAANRPLQSPECANCRSATQRAILLAALSDEDARTRYLQQHQQSYAALLERLGDSRSSIEAAALMSPQIIGLLVARYILRVPRLVLMSRERLVREVGETLQGYVRIASG
jgi:hypothetical protein